MPKITIREEDLTSAGITNNSTNAVYIPGYAVMGPVNTPTLCESLEDFQAIFGTSPYIFRTNQDWPTGFDSDTPEGYFAEEGDAEKSFIMASELLRQGLPVYYERVFPAKSVDAWSAICNFTATVEEAPVVVLNLKSATPGLVSKDLYCKVEVDTVPLNESGAGANATYYVLSVGRKANVNLGTPEVSEVSTKFTFDNQLAKDYSSITYYKDLQGQVDNSGLVTFNFTDNAQVIEVIPEKEYSFTLEPPTTGDVVNDEFTVENMYEYLSLKDTDDTTMETQGYARFLDKGEYVLKFLTSGAYPVFEYNNNAIVTNMLTKAADRGDAIALFDHTPNNSRVLAATNTSSVYAKVKEYCQTNRVNELSEPIYTYGAMYTPYGIYSNSVIDGNVELPGSFAYLLSLAVSVVNNANWYAVAGVTRGIVPNLLGLSQNVTNAIAESYTPRDDISINPITNIKPYGLTIWGNRTLKNNAKAGDLTATSFMNVRQLVCDVKRNVFVASKRLTFEQNNDVLWINFKAQLVPTLEEMLQGNGLTGYQLIKQKTTAKATLKAKIVLQVVEAVEDFDITISLTDSESTISE